MVFSSVETRDERFFRRVARSDNFVFGGMLPSRSMMTLVDTFRHKSLRQGDPLSVMLFNIVADLLAILIERAKVDGQTKGVVPRR
jgi:hypothetical protein